LNPQETGICWLDYENYHILQKKTFQIYGIKAILGMIARDGGLTAALN